MMEPNSANFGDFLNNTEGKPWAFWLGGLEPHRTYEYGSGVRKGKQTSDIDRVPAYWPDNETIRNDMLDYAVEVEHFDAHVMRALDLLEDSGQLDNTLVVMTSDHGMPLPFAKTQLYHHSTHTPLMVRWPGVTTAGSEDTHHMVSAIDFIPTLLDVMGYSHPDPDSLHGRSFAPILKGKPQSGRDFVIKQYNENAGRNRHPMRGIETRELLYLYNPWSDGKRKFATATTGTATYRQMVKLSQSDPTIAARRNLFDHRVLEELYDVQSDPDCLVNLVADPAHSEQLASLRKQLTDSLAGMSDPVAPLLADVDNAELRNSYMAAEDARTLAARKKKTKAKKAADKKQNEKRGKAKPS